MKAKTLRAQTERRKTLRPSPRRDEIVDAMRSYGRPISPTRLAEITGRTLGSTAYHMKTLSEAGVVVLADQSQARGAMEHFYALVPENEADLNDAALALQRLFGLLTLPSVTDDYPRPVELDAIARGELQEIIELMRPKAESIVHAAARRADERSRSISS